jgi:hypothetical protein
MPLTRLDNLLSSKTGKYLYVSPDDFNATDALDNRGNSPTRPFLSIQRAFLEVARFSYLPGIDNDRFDQFTIMLSPGVHHIDNRPGIENVDDLPVFQYNQALGEWETNSNVSFDLSDPNNILYKFNGRDGGATIPRGTSLVGMDLRRTQLRPLYVPDPADKDVPRCSLFNVTGGCYFWQFTIQDGDLSSNSPLYDATAGIGKVYTQPNDTVNKLIPEFSHHKITNFVFADRQDLGLLYRKISHVFSDYQPPIDDVFVEGETQPITEYWSSTVNYSAGNKVLYNGQAYLASTSSINSRPNVNPNKWSLMIIRSREFDFRIQENRIVGPLQDAIRLEEVRVDDSVPVGITTLTVRTKINHGFFPGQYVAITNNGLNDTLNGVFQVASISATDPKVFTYRVSSTATGLGLVSGTTYTAASSPPLDTNSTVQAEVDSVESASPYVFNVSIRSTWGICGIWANGRKASGFKSMVIAQYTGVSLQKDDRAFIRYDEFSNTWNQAPLTDAFATTPYHIKGDAYWKDDWRNFHVKASDDSFIQCVSIFAVGFADHFLMESGGDMSITNSNSNFGNTSLHAIGFKGFAFNQDKGGYITDIIPPKLLSTLNVNRKQYYTFDVPLIRGTSLNPNSTRLYLGTEDARNPEDRPAGSIDGYRLGAKRNEKIFVKLDASASKSADLIHSGFKKWTASLSTLNPIGVGFTTEFNLKQDAANLIDANKTFIQAEAFGYILDKYPNLQNIPYVNPNITSETGRYRDASTLIKANRQEIIDYAFSKIQIAFPSFVVPGGGNADEKCKRDIGYIVDAIADDLYSGGNSNMIDATKTYFNSSGQLISNGLAGEETQSIFAFNRAKDWCKKAISNLLTNTSLLDNPALSASGTTITVTTATPHNLQANDFVTVGGATQTQFNGRYQVLSAGLTSTQFRYTVTSAPSVANATGAVYVSTITIDPLNDDANVGRFKDASKLITSNRQEIIDRAAAEIAVQFPDFYYPGDPQTTSTSRYKDAYRLIQQNKQEIIDGAYAQIIIDFPSFVNPNETKCKRDIEYFIDAVSLDVVQGGGNVYSRKFVQQYFVDASTPLPNGLLGEEGPSVSAFTKARNLMKAALANQLTIKDLTITAGKANYNGTGLTIANTDAVSCADVQLAIDTLSFLITSRIAAGNLTGLPAESFGSSPAGETKCKRDIAYIVDSIAQDIFWGGNEFTVGSVREYFTQAGTPIPNGLVGEIAQSVAAFNKAREWCKRAITNQLYAKNLNISTGPAVASGSGGNISYTQSGNGAICIDVQSTVDSLFSIVTSVINAGNINALPTVDNGDWDCANVRRTIDTLVNIINSSLLAGNLNNLPVRNIGPWSQVSDASKCKRDIGYIVEAITSDLKLGGNINTINAAESYYTGTQLDYIENEKLETLDAYRYVRDLAISAMRNHNTYISNASTTNGSSIVTIPSTVGLAIGMKVRSVAAIPTSSSSTITYTTNIPTTAYIKKIGDGLNGLATNKIQLGTQGSKFDIGSNVNATATSTGVNLYVELTQGVWSTELAPSTDFSITQDYNYLTPGDIATGAPGGECASVASTLVNYYQILSTVINSGVGSVPRVASTLNTSGLAQRATLFSLTEFDSNGIPTTNPHQLETGTPIRLVPRAKSGVNVDKRVIRLPKGFDTNTIYYVIAPGRKTDPYDYSNIGLFNGSNQQNLLLATSSENAAAGIYIYSSETDGIDSNVEIDVYQYILDLNYDLHQYQTKIVVGSSSILETDRPHVFDKPSTNVTPQLVFFRIGSDIVGSSLPTLSSTFGGATISSKTLFYVRYVSSTRFTIHETFANARDNINPISFQPGSSAVFYTFADKRRSPLRYDPKIGVSPTDGCWYIETLSTGNTIIPRIKQSDYAGRLRTTDSYFERIEDNRTKEDRIYRLRYVVPKNLKTVRDPIRGFVLKIRTDEKRRLLPQKILLKPTSTGADTATLLAPVSGERLGLSLQEQITLNPNFSSTYDPSPFGNPKRLETNAKVAFTVQSARKVLLNGKNYLQLNVFDIGIDAEAYKTKILTTVKISSPEGGNGFFVASVINSNNTNRVTWAGNCSGTAYVHGYFAYENEYYMILKDFTGNSFIDYYAATPTVFTQGSVTATLLDKPNSGRSDIINNPYVVEGANVYTLTPGDRVNDDNGVSYTIAEVEDVPDIHNTFYIFDINTIRRRISGQQDGIYYLTCIRGDISPYPTGSGVGINFRNFKFSQPVSKLYPEFYKNDPEWYKGVDISTTTLSDPPPTVSTADNYVHGLVTVNDAKNSLTKELILDFIQDPGTGGYTFSGDSSIKAQSGTASAGSESRKIPINGNSLYPTEGKLYVELRRPSIARAGNHTFEYLGFGPGNYSTGLPARQEIVLTDVQDFYSQAKKQDAGIVFYTGLNSNGDLYIGNRKINAITGEETFLESAKLVESSDEIDPIDGLVTTFDTAVTFNEIITVNGSEGKAESFFNAPIVINNTTSFGSVENFPSLKIVTGEGTSIGYDPYLEINISQQKTGDIILHQGRIQTSVVDFNPRGLQDYQIMTALSNRTPDLTNTFGISTSGPSQLQNTNFGSKFPLVSGLIQLKGDQTLFTGSLGWIYANDYIRIENRSGTISGFTFNPQIIGIQGAATGTTVRLNWNLGITNNSLNITSSSQIRITGASGSLGSINGVWPVYSTSQSPFNGANNFVTIIVNSNLPQFTGIPLPNNGYPVDSVTQPGIVIEKSKSAFKEFGVLGSESIRTETETIGDYKVGINTVARSAHSAYQTAFVDASTTPRANLDVVGTGFISGKKILSYLTQTGTNKTETNRDDAFVVGGDSANPLTAAATLRIATTNNGRVGINVNNANLDRTLVVSGNGRITGDFKFESDIEVNGGDITTTNAVFNIANQPTALTFDAGAWATTVNLFNSATASQTINIGTSATNTGNLNIHSNIYNSTVNIATAPQITNPSTPTQPPSSLITFGGAINNQSQSIFRVRNYQTVLDGILEIKGDQIAATTPNKKFIMFPSNLTSIKIAPTAGEVEIGGSVGTTLLRNGLKVNNKAIFESDIEQNGGFRNSSVGVTRNTFGTIKISKVSRTGNTATVTTTLNHNLSTNNQVRILCSNSQFTTIGTVSITVSSSSPTEFTYQTTGTGTITQQTATGTVILPNVGKSHSQGSLTGIGGATLTNLNVDYYEYIENIASSQNISGLVTITSPNTATKLIISDNTLVPGNAIIFTNVGNFTGVSTATTYYVLNADTNGVTLSTTSGGIPITVGYTSGTTSPGTAAVRLKNTLIDPIGSSAVSSTTTTIPINNPDGLNQIGIYLLINTEIVRTTNLPSTVTPYTVEVERGVDGTAPIAHQPSDKIVRLIKTENAAYIFPAAVGDSITNINLAEFSGAFKINDILRIDKNTSSEEFVTITTINESAAQTFSINNGGSGASKQVTFNVITTTGNTDILGDVTIGYDDGTLSSTSSLVSGTIVTGGGNLKVHNSIELSGNTSTTIPEKQYFVITNGSSPRLYVDSNTGNTRLYNGANFQVFKDSFFASGTFDKSRVDVASDIAFEILGSSGNTKLSGTLTIGDDFTIKNGLSGTSTIKMDAQLGTTVIGLPLTAAANGATLTLNATYSTTAPAATPVFSIDNLGISNNKPFRIRLDGSIQAFGIDNYYTKNGGRRTEFIAAANGDLSAIAERLKPNIQYLVRPTGNLTLYLPLASDCVTGDIVRIIDIQGNLNYDIALKIRSEPGTNIQKSQGGTNSYSGGELIVNTPNAGFGLMFVGDFDSKSPSTAIPSDNRGWWLVEV